MTYRELAVLIINDPTQWDNDITVHDYTDSEFYPAVSYPMRVGNTDVLDKRHLVIVPMK